MLEPGKGKLLFLLFPRISCFGAGYRSTDRLIEKVKAALRDFRTLATSNGVAPVFIDIMESRLRELSPDIFAPPASSLDLIRFEMTDSGSIHLYATIDGREKRRVFTKKSESYEAVLGAMKKSLTREEQEAILKRFFNHS